MTRCLVFRKMTSLLRLPQNDFAAWSSAKWVRCLVFRKNEFAACLHKMISLVFGLITSLGLPQNDFAWSSEKWEMAMNEWSQMNSSSSTLEPETNRQSVKEEKEAVPAKRGKWQWMKMIPVTKELSAQPNLVAQTPKQPTFARAGHPHLLPVLRLALLWLRSSPVCVTRLSWSTQHRYLKYEADWVDNPSRKLVDCCFQY